MILRIGRRGWAASQLLLQRPHARARARASSISMETESALSLRSLSSLSSSRGFASQPAAVADDASYDNQPGFDEDEDVTVNTWLQDYRRGVLQPRVVPFQVSVDEAKREFERWHASSWLSPTGLLKGAVAGPGLPPDSATAAATAAASKAAAKAAKAQAAAAAAAAAAADASPESEASATTTTTTASTPNPSPSPLPPTINAVLLPFWLFETAVRVDFRAEVLVSSDSEDSPDSSSRSNSNASASSTASHSPRSSGWRDTGWRSRGYREYPWTLSACQVCASYGVRRDLARAAAVPGVLGRSRPLRQWEASAGRAVDVGWAGSCGASGRRRSRGAPSPTPSPSTPSPSSSPSDPGSPDFSYSFSAFSATATATGDSGAPLAPRDMRQSVAWALALRSIRKSEAESAQRLLEREVKARSRSSSSSSSSSPSSSSSDNHTPTSESSRSSCSSSSSSSSSSTASEETVRDVRVRLRPLKRRARVVYLPAYVLTYSLGERIGPEGGRRPATFQALVSGLDATSVAGERHLSPLKVQVVAGVGAAGVALLGGMWSKGGASAVPSSSASASSSSLALLDPVSLAFWSFLAVAAGGVAARAATHLMREAEEAERLRAEEEAFERAAAAGLGPTAAAVADFASSNSSSSSSSSSCSSSSSPSCFSSEDLAAAAAEREASEWRRWEEADRWSWDSGARAAWADALVREQARRRLDARRLRERAAAAAAKAAADAAAEGRRRERFGGGSSGAESEGAGGGGGGGGFSWAGAPSSPSSWPAGRDHLGFYRALGLSPADSPTPEAVKLAFRSAAFRLHPDRVASQRRREGREEEEERQRSSHFHHSSHAHSSHQHHLGDAPGRARAAARFARVRAAYEVLRDPERRADYDRGGTGSELNREAEGGRGGGGRRHHHRRWY